MICNSKETATELMVLQIRVITPWEKKSMNAEEGIVHLMLMIFTQERKRVGQSFPLMKRVV